MGEGFEIHTSVTSVLVIEDHALVAHTISRVLNATDGVRVSGSVSSLQEALLALEQERPSVVLTDYHLPDGDGVAAIGKIEAHSDPPVPVVVMTGDLSPAVLSRCLDAGAAGFVRKHAEFEQLVQAVQAAARGDAAVLDRQALQDLAAMHQARQSMPELTERQRQILHCLARGHDAAGIAEELSLSIHTVRNYISALLEKLDAGSQLQAVTKALRLGMLVPDDLR